MNAYEVPGTIAGKPFRRLWPGADDTGVRGVGTAWGQPFATDLPWRCWRCSLTLDSESGDNPGSTCLGDSDNVIRGPAPKRKMARLTG